MSPTQAPSEFVCGKLAERCSTWSDCCSRRCVLGLCARPDNEDSVQSVGEGPTESHSVLSGWASEILGRGSNEPAPEEQLLSPTEVETEEFRGRVDVSFSNEGIGIGSVLTALGTIVDAVSETAEENVTTETQLHQCGEVGNECSSFDTCCSKRCIMGLCAKSS